MSYSHGIKAQDYFIEQLRKEEIEYEFKDDWYDYEINNEKVEVKSCRLTIRHILRKQLSYRIGRFDFTSEENREKQHEENIWIAFIIRHQDQHILLGLCQANQLNKRRYISIHHTRTLDLLTLQEFNQATKKKSKNKYCVNCYNIRKEEGQKASDLCKPCEEAIKDEEKNTP